LAGVTTGKLSTLNNHLVGCVFCPDEVKTRACNWKNDGKEMGEDTEAVQASTSVVSLTVSAKRSRSDSVNIDNRVGKQQKKFTVMSAKAHSFPPSKQIGFEEQLLRAFISAGWSFNSISDPEVQRLFHNYIPGAVVPTRQKLSNQILAREITKIQGTQKEASRSAYATLQCDGWKDISKKHIVAFTYTANREVYQLK
jgi:hypothetical protein